MQASDYGSNALSEHVNSKTTAPSHRFILQVLDNTPDWWEQTRSAGLTYMFTQGSSGLVVSEGKLCWKLRLTGLSVGRRRRRLANDGGGGEEERGDDNAVVFEAGHRTGR